MHAISALKETHYPVIFPTDVLKFNLESDGFLVSFDVCMMWECVTVCVNACLSACPCVWVCGLFVTAVTSSWKWNLNFLLCHVYVEKNKEFKSRLRFQVYTMISFD